MSWNSRQWSQMEFSLNMPWKGTMLQKPSVLDLSCSAVGSDECGTWLALVVRLSIVLWLEAVSFATILRLVPSHSGQG